MALALFNAALATALAALAVRAVGRVGWLVPAWLWVTAPPFLARVVRLRPELLALLVLLLALEAATRRDGVRLGILAWAFALGYTAFHVFLATCGLWLACAWWRERRPDARLIVPPLLGTVLGLAVRPHPWANLQLWFVQDVRFFFEKGRLDVGDEILPPHLVAIAHQSAAWLGGLAGLALLAWLARRRPTGAAATRLSTGDRLVSPPVLFAVTAALLYAGLFLLFARMATYAFPLATVAVLVLLPPLRRAAIWVLAASLLLALPLAADPTLMRLLRGGARSGLEWAAFGRAVPEGALVAADWGSAELYAFWAPQGRYLDVLDPIFMALPYPRRYRAMRWLFAGIEPDVPATVHDELASDYLAFDRTLAPPSLVARAAHDPRLVPVYDGFERLLRVRPSDRFLTRWQGAPAPRSAYVGFVDATATAGSGCAVLRTVVTLAAPARFELAPWGPTWLAVDGQVVAHIDRLAGAILGTGVAVDLGAGRHQLVVRTCRAGGRAGFYLLRH